MDTYAIQNFFKNLCQTHDSAYSELKRIKKESKVDNKFINSVYEWEILLQKTEFLIVKTIKQIRNQRIKIVITTKAEVYALILYYAMLRDTGFDILNVGEEFTKLIPEDEICQEFIKAYLKKDIAKMGTLYDKTYVKDIGSDEVEFY